MNRWKPWLPVVILAMGGCAMPTGTIPPGIPDEGSASTVRDAAARKPHVIDGTDVTKPTAEPVWSESTDRQIRALARAARRGDVRTIDRLVNSGVDVNGKFDTNTPKILGVRTYATPLYWSMESYGPGPFGGGPTKRTGSARGFERLLQLGANPNVVLFNDHNLKNFSRESSVMHASVEHPNPKFLELALEYGGDPNVIVHGEFGGTPVHTAARWGNKEGLLMLLDAGGEMDALDIGGGSPVSSATAQGGFDLALMLLERGASYRTGGPGPLTPLSYSPCPPPLGGRTS